MESLNTLPLEMTAAAILHAVESFPVADEMESVLSAIKTANSFLIISHLRPDGDAVGSVAGLARSLRKAGKHADIGLIDSPPERFEFLLKDEFLVHQRGIESGYDVIFILDSGDLPRTGFEHEFDELFSVLINIDHHASNTGFGDINWLDFSASSTCEMITTLIQGGNLPLDADVAEPLYLGLLTDSRFFQNENISPRAHQTAATLLATGLDVGPLLALLNGGRLLSELRILGMGLTKLRVDCDGALVSVVLTKEDLAACGATLENVWACGLFNQLNTLRGAIVGLSVVEGPDGKSYCEFRSRAGFDVKSIAVAMGGGGHLAASGCNKMAPVLDVSKEALEHLSLALSGKSLLNQVRK